MMEDIWFPLIQRTSKTLFAGFGGDNAFETQLARIGIHSYLLDSVERRPENLGPTQSFEAKQLGNITDANFIKLSDWVLKSNADLTENMMLKVDIEGME